MTPIQLGPTFGAQEIVVLIVAGAIALFAGVVIRFRMEGSRSTDGGGFIGIAGPAGTTESGSPPKTSAATRDQGGAADAAAAGAERDGGGSTRGAVAREEPEEADPSEPEPSGQDHRPPDPLATAAERYDRGEYDDSVQGVYMYVRRQVAQELDAAVDGTHWDFFERATGTGDPVQAEPLRQLTEVYERAAFGSEPATADDADAAFALATELADVADPRRA